MTTLLDLVQTVLSSLDGDEVNSISDTTEAMQVARIVKTAYEAIVPRANLPEHMSLFSLTASGNNAYPTIMTLPSNITNVFSLKYNRVLAGNTDADWTELDFVPLSDFLELVYTLRPSADTAALSFNYPVGSQSVQFLCRNDVGPSYYSTFDDFTFVFDAYDSAVDTTLQSSKTLGYGRQKSVFSLSDSYIPDIDDEQLPLLLQEAKALAWAEMKQTTHEKAEREARRQWNHLQVSKHAIPGWEGYYQRTPNYGRVANFGGLPVKRRDDMGK